MQFNTVKLIDLSCLVRMSEHSPCILRGTFKVFTDNVTVFKWMVQNYHDIFVMVERVMD